jgi:hypothetical protein
MQISSSCQSIAFTTTIRASFTPLGPSISTFSLEVTPDDEISPRRACNLSARDNHLRARSNLHNPRQLYRHHRRHSSQPARPGIRRQPLWHNRSVWLRFRHLHPGNVIRSCHAPLQLLSKLDRLRLSRWLVSPGYRRARHRRQFLRRNRGRVLLINRKRHRLQNHCSGRADYIAHFLRTARLR